MCVFSSAAFCGDRPAPARPRAGEWAACIGALLFAVHPASGTSRLLASRMYCVAACRCRHLAILGYASGGWEVRLWQAIARPGRARGDIGVGPGTFVLALLPIGGWSSCGGVAPDVWGWPRPGAQRPAVWRGW
jgi:hypothetical protein